jgi:hypothetical protein
MPWIALREQQIKRDGQYITVKAGEALPEAEFWPNRSAWVRTKRIANVPNIPDVGKPVEISVPIPEPKPEVVVEKVKEILIEKSVIKEPEPELELAKPAVAVKTRKRGRPKRKKVN